MSLQIAEEFISLEVVGPNPGEKVLLNQMRFVAPYLGLIVTGPEVGTIGLWVSEADKYREFRILSSTISPNGKLPFDEGWSYGTIRADELFATPDPLQAAVDASYHIETSNGFSTNFLDILLALHYNAQPRANARPHWD